MNMKRSPLHWPRRILTITGVVILLLILALPAAAISFGEPDGNDHPFVGSMVLRVPSGPDEGLYQICSGKQPPS